MQAVTRCTRRTLLLAPAPLAWGAARPKVVFVLGDHEYSGEATLPLLAAALETRAGYSCQILKSTPDQNGETDIPGLQALRTADLAIFYLRWRRLPPHQLAEIDKYAKSGRPLVGFRTTSHSFNYPQGHPDFAWNRWASEAFGTPPGWGGDGHTHFGHQASTQVRIEPANAKHAILKGVEPRFAVRSWLYRVRPKWPPPEATVLLHGTAVNPNKAAEENPVAWTWKNPWGGRAFFTTLGHPEDFAVESMQRLSWNGIAWALGRKPAKWPGKLKIDVPYRGMVKT